MNNISELIYILLAQTGGPEAVGEAQEVVKTVEVAGMSWDGWLMLLFGVLLLYGGLAVCLWIAAGRGNPEVWTEEEEESEPGLSPEP